MNHEPEARADEPEESEEPSLLDQVREELSQPVEEQRLTPEEEERLRLAAAGLRRTLNPRVTSLIADLQRTGALGRAYTDINKWGRLGTRESLIKGALGKGVFASGFQSKTLGKLMAQQTVEPPWMKQLKFINSDAYKFGGLWQSNLTALNSILAKNADFGFNNSAAKMAARFASQQNSLLANIVPKLASFRFNIYPVNLQNIDGLRIEEVEAVVMLDGIALYRVPRQEIAEQLIRAESTADRREVLGRRSKAISADCRAALDGCGSSSVASHVSFARSALDALDGGNAQAAQALAASVLDTVVSGYFGTDRYKYTPDIKGKRTTEEYEKFTVREFIAFAPLWQAYQKYKVEDGDQIPRTFSRHASVHGVSSRQFSRRNAVQALLFVCGLLAFLDEEATKLEAA